MGNVKNAPSEAALDLVHRGSFVPAAEAEKANEQLQRTLDDLNETVLLQKKKRSDQEFLEIPC